MWRKRYYVFWLLLVASDFDVTNIFRNWCKNETNVWQNWIWFEYVLSRSDEPILLLPEVNSKLNRRPTLAITWARAVQCVNDLRARICMRHSINGARLGLRATVWYSLRLRCVPFVPSSTHKTAVFINSPHYQPLIDACTHTTADPGRQQKYELLCTGDQPEPSHVW